MRAVLKDGHTRDVTTGSVTGIRVRRDLANEDTMEDIGEKIDRNLEVHKPAQRSQSLHSLKGHNHKEQTMSGSIDDLFSTLK